MRKLTSICHYGAGVIAALCAIEWAVLITLMFFSLEAWDCVNGNKSWWDWQEYVCGFIGMKGLVLLLAILFGEPEACS